MFYIACSTFAAVFKMTLPSALPTKEMFTYVDDDDDDDVVVVSPRLTKFVTKKGRVKRPMNAYLLFSREMRHACQHHLGPINQGNDTLG